MDMPTRSTVSAVHLRLFEGIRPLDRAHLSSDVVAGVTLAALGIPEVLGYANIAGLPVVTGLYTILIPIALFAVFGSSRHLVVGADSASAAILAAGLAGMAAVGSPQYVALAGLVALLTAGLLLLARVVGLGFLADFLSRSVLVGFLTGVGIQVACGQVAGILGVPGGSGGTLEKLWGTLKQVDEISWATFAVSLSVLVVIAGFKRFAPSVPGALIAVIGMIAISYAFDLAGDGVSVLGPVPGGLPSLGLPDVTWSDAGTLLPTAGAIFFVILAQSAATSRAYAARYNDRFSENTDLVGLGIANLGAGLSGTFVVNGSPTKTQMVDGAGGRSQISCLATSAIVLIVLLFLTKPLQYMPDAVLATIVFLIGIELISVKGMRHVRQLAPAEFLVAVATTAAVVIFGVEQGIILAIVLSMIAHVRRGYRPRNVVLMRTSAIRWKPVPADQAAEAVPGMIIYRFAASLYYANTNHFEEQLRTLVARDPELRWLCIDAGVIADVDYSAGQALLEIQPELARGGVRMVWSSVSDDVRAQLDRYGLTDLIGADAYFETFADAVAAFEHTTTGA